MRCRNLFHGVFMYSESIAVLYRAIDIMGNVDMYMAEKKPMTIKLPKDIEGRDIPLDTEILYGVTGHTHHVEQFEYSVMDGVWRVQFEDGVFHFRTSSETYLTRPDNL